MVPRSVFNTTEAFSNSVMDNQNRTEIMLEINGIPPKLTGYECEEMICQQYWYLGKLENEMDVLFLRANGKWHQLYFESGVIFWRIQNE